MQHAIENGHDDTRGEHQDVVYAGFWRRWIALILDQLILGAAFYGVLIVLVILAGISGGFGAVAAMDADEPPTWVIVAYLAAIVLYYVGAGLYFALMESSRHQATLGKMALGIKVVDERGHRLSFSHALGRWFAAALSYLTLYVGFLMAAFTGRKRALHDMVAGTLVVDRWAYTAQPELQKRELGGCLIAAVAVVVLMVLVSVLAILAAIALPAYSDYTQRSKVAEAMAGTAELRLAVAGFRQAEGRCPIGGEDGFGGATGRYATRVEVGEFDEGGCGIEMELGGTGHQGLDGGEIWWELGADGDWACWSSVEDRWLPPACRG